MLNHLHESVIAALGTGWRSVAYIASVTRLSPATVREVLRHAQARGEVIVDDRWKESFWRVVDQPKA